MTVSWAISMAYHKSENRNRMVLNGVGGWSVPPARTTKELQDICLLTQLTSIFTCPIKMPYIWTSLNKYFSKAIH